MRFKEAMISYDTHSTFVKQTLILQSICNRIIPQDLKDLITAILQPGSQLQWRTWWKDETQTIEQQRRDRDKKISQDQLFGEGDYADVQKQSLYDDHTLDLSYAAALNSQDRIEEIKKKIRSFTKVCGDQR